MPPQQLLPGGTTNPDALRQDEAAVAFVKAFTDGEKPLAAIRHGPWMLVEAEAARGREAIVALVADAA